MAMPAGLKRYWKTHGHKSKRVSLVSAGRRNVARYYGKNVRARGKKKITIPLAVVAGFIPLGNQVYQMARGGNAGNIPLVITQSMTGYNYNSGTWSAGEMKNGLLPILGGFAIHKVVGGMLGFNRMIAQAGIPYVRI